MRCMPESTKAFIAILPYHNKGAMNAFVDSGMHLIFHGIVAYIVEQMETFSVYHSPEKKFETMINKHLLEIQSFCLE